MQFLEMKNHNVKFKRVDAELASGLKGEEIAADDKEAASEYKCLEKLFKEATGNDKLKMKLENIKSDQMTAVILQSEESRRMKDFARLYSGMNIPIPEEDDETLVLNRNNSDS